MRAPSAQAFAEGWIAAWNTHDLDAILSHYADEIEFSSPVATALVGEGRIRGIADLRAYWTQGLSLNAGLHFDLLDVLCGEGFLTLLYDNERKQRVAETFEFDDAGRVTRACACYRAAAQRRNDD